MLYRVLSVGVTMSAYTQVKIPTELTDEIDTIVSKGTLGYKSRAEFIKDAIRSKLIDNATIQTQTVEVLAE